MRRPRVGVEREAGRRAGPHLDDGLRRCSSRQARRRACRAGVRGDLRGERFEHAGWHGAGLLRTCGGDADDALARGVLVVPAGVDGGLIQATPPLTITDAEVEEALYALRA